MRNPSQSPTPYGYAGASDVTWSRAEKAVAHRAYDAAVDRELREVMEDARERASRIRQPSDVWDLEQYLTQRRKKIDRKYQFRSSHLTQVLGELLHEKRISERGLSRVRTELFELTVIPAPAPQPVQMHRQLPSHRYLRNL
jgi:hypothetical protein